MPWSQLAPPRVGMGRARILRRYFILKQNRPRSTQECSISPSADSRSCPRQDTRMDTTTRLSQRPSSAWHSVKALELTLTPLTAFLQETGPGGDHHVMDTALVIARCFLSSPRAQFSSSRKSGSNLRLSNSSQWFPVPYPRSFGLQVTASVPLTNRTLGTRHSIGPHTRRSHTLRHVTSAPWARSGFGSAWGVCSIEDGSNRVTMFLLDRTGR
ncbi:hypothetical protein VTK56DRAFT_4760 [Thermocarpiscus australiensis]